jgi:hypothetical protein
MTGLVPVIHVGPSDAAGRWERRKPTKRRLPIDFPTWMAGTEAGHDASLCLLATTVEQTSQTIVHTSSKS